MTKAQSTPKSPISEMLSELRKEGTESRRGGFTLDREKAREKMSSFSLADPRSYVLELVQAGVLMQDALVRQQVTPGGDQGGLLVVDATPLRFDIDSDDVHLRFGGMHFTVEDFDQIYESLFSGGVDRRSRARRQLALGLNAALALNPRFVRVVSGNSEGSAVLELRPGRPDHYEAREEPAVGTHIHVKSRFRPGLLMQFYRNVAGTIAEEALLKERCGRSWFPIDLEGRALAAGLGVPETPDSVAIPSAGLLLGRVGFIPGHSGPARLKLYKNGVYLTTHHRDDLPLGLVAAVDAVTLRKDVSQANVVVNDAYLEVVERVRSAAAIPLANLGRRFMAGEGGEGGAPDPHREWAWERLRVAMRLQQSVDALRDAQAPALGQVLYRIPFWQSIDGRWWSLVHILAECEDAEVGWTQETYSERLSELDRLFISDAPIVLHLPHEADVTLMKRLFGPRLTHQTAALDRILLQEENRRAWRSRRVEPDLAAVDGARSYLATERVKSDEIRCQVGLLAESTGDFELHCLVDGHLLCKRSISGLCDGVIGGVVAVVEGDLRPNEGFDDVLSDGGLAQALETVLLGLRRVHDRLATDWVDARRTGAFYGSLARNKLRAELLPREAELRVRMIAYLDLVGGADFGGDYFRAFGVERQGLSGTLRDEPRPRQWRPVLEAEPGEADDEGAPYDRLPLFATVNGHWLSGAALRHWIQERGELRWVNSEQPQESECNAQILWLSRPGQRVLAVVFGADRLREDEVGYRVAREEVEHLRKRTEPVEVNRSPRDLFVVRFWSGGLEGELGMRNQLLAPLGRWETRVLRKQRPLVTRRHVMSLPSGRGVVNSDTLLPNAQWDDVLEGAELNAVWGILWRAAQQLLVRLAPLENLSEDRRKDARELIGTGLCAWFPPVLAGGFRALRSRSEDDDQAVALYEELLQPLGAVSPEILAPIIDARLAADSSLPEPAQVFAQLPAQIWPRDRATPPLALGFTRWDGDLGRWVDDGEAPIEVEPGGERVLRRLLETPVFKTNHATGVSAWEVLELSAAGEPIHFVHSYWSDRGETDERVLIVSGPELELLRSLAGSHGVRHGGALLKEASRRKSFLARAAVDAMVLAPTDALVRLELDEDGVQGQVGLAVDTEAGSWIDLHQERRLICRREGFTKPGLVATINDDRLTVKRDYTYVEKNDRLGQVYGCCEALREPLYGLLIDQWDGLEASIRRGHGPWLLTYFADVVGASFTESDSIEDPVLARLAQLKLLEGLGDAWLSLEELRQSFLRTGRVDYLLSAREGEPLDPSRVVVMANRKITVYLKRIFGTLRDYAPQWDDDQVLVALGRRGAPALPPEDPEAGLVRAQFRISPWEGTIYLPESPATELVIRFGVRGVEAICWQPSRVFPCAGRFDTDRVRVFRRNQRDGITDAQERILERQAWTLYQALARRFRQGSLSEEERDAARVYLRHAICRLHVLIQGDTHEQLNRYWRNFYGRLIGLPLFPLDSGEWVSLKGALELRPPELAVYGLWGDGGESSLPTGLVIGPPRMVYLEPEPHEGEQGPDDEGVDDEGVDEDEDGPDDRDEDGPDDRDEDGLDDRDDDEDEVVEGAVAVQDLEQMETLSAEERLVADLRSALLEQHTPESRLPDHVMLLSIRLSPDPSDCAVACDPAGIKLFRRHPVVGALMDDAPGQQGRRAAALAMVVLGVYTAVNLYLEEVTDDHEAEFQHLLVQRLRSRVLGESVEEPVEEPVEESV